MGLHVNAQLNDVIVVNKLMLMEQRLRTCKNRIKYDSRMAFQALISIYVVTHPLLIWFVDPLLSRTVGLLHLEL
jgi:hypothetical protein